MLSIKLQTSSWTSVNILWNEKGRSSKETKSASGHGPPSSEASPTATPGPRGCVSSQGDGDWLMEGDPAPPCRHTARPSPTPSRNPHTANHRSFPAPAKCGSGSQEGRPAISPAQDGGRFTPHGAQARLGDNRGVHTTGTPDTPLRIQLGFHRGIWKRQAVGRKQVERELQLQVRCGLSGTAFSVEPGSLQSKKGGRVSPQTPKPHNPCSDLHTQMHLGDSQMDSESIQQRFWTDPGMAVHQPHPPRTMPSAGPSAHKASL